ncbi:hypothetical protein [Streptomyces sp. ALI-76-A]|nr:hypothetical protein [Streptomyces sp. ALI-76-A]MDL5200200.1 hypothetical protein [Streptomyces sp. ALI-76-A]
MSATVGVAAARLVLGTGTVTVTARVSAAPAELGHASAAQT